MIDTIGETRQINAIFFLLFARKNTKHRKYITIQRINIDPFINDNKPKGANNKKVNNMK